MRNAVNHLGWVVEEFILPDGWKHSKLYPEVYETYYQALEVLRGIYDTEHFRVNESLISKQQADLAK